MLGTSRDLQMKVEVTRRHALGGGDAKVVSVDSSLGRQGHLAVMRANLVDSQLDGAPDPVRDSEPYTIKLPSTYCSRSDTNVMSG